MVNMRRSLGTVDAEAEALDGQRRANMQHASMASTRLVVGRSTRAWSVPRPQARPEHAADTSELVSRQAI